MLSIFNKNVFEKQNYFSVQTGGGAGRDARTSSRQNEREVRAESEQNLAKSSIGEQH